MNFFARNGNVADEERQKYLELLADFAERHPVLTEQLLGIPGKPEDGGVQPASVRFFLNGGRLKCQISPKGSFDSIFTTVDDLSSPIYDVEQKLQGGNFELKRGSERVPTF